MSNITKLETNYIFEVSPSMRLEMTNEQYNNLENVLVNKEDCKMLAVRNSNKEIFYCAIPIQLFRRELVK